MSELPEKIKNDEKLKNDEKPKTKPEHQGYFKILMVLWGFNSFRGLEGVFELQSQLNRYYTNGGPSTLSVMFLQFQVILGVVAIPAAIAFVWGLWNWKKWGYFGIIGIVLSFMAIDVINGLAFQSPVNFAFAVARCVPLSILYIVMRGKTQFLS